MTKTPLLVILGPTASGKTGLASRLSDNINAEMISAHSMQIYKGMEIASAAPTAEETANTPCHLTSFLSVDTNFTVADYTRLAAELIKDISARGKLPVLVGGTGLYIDSLVNNIQFSYEENTDEIRARLMAEAYTHGIEPLFERLKKIDPGAASKLSLSDRKRIIRALEIYELHGITKTELDARAASAPSPYEPLFIGLKFENRELLCQRIEKRVGQMLQNGILEEAEHFYKKGLGKTAVQAIGHKEFYPYFRGEKSLEECTERLIISTRQYAKRQMTWFSKNQNINWITVDRCDNVAAAATEIIKLKGGETFCKYFLNATF